MLGGSGFVGRHTVRALARDRWRVRAAVRRPDLAGHLQPMGDVGQIHAVQANLRYPDSVRRAVEGADAVVNLVAVLAKSGPQTFHALHVAGARAAAKAAREAGVKTFVQVSALGADRKANSRYARSKAAGEAAVLEEFPGAVILRPSLVFGAEDQLFNRFAAMARFSPALPLIGGGTTKFQPVFVGDIAQAVTRLIDAGIASGHTYEFGGPEVMSFRELIEFTLHTVGRKRLLVSLPWAVARIQAMVLELLPKPLLTTDQLELLKRDNIVSAEAKAERRTLEGLGITPCGIEAIVPAYLYRYRKAGEFSAAAF